MLDGMLSLQEKIAPYYAAAPERLQLRLFPGGHSRPLAAEQAGLEGLSRWLKQ
jgi:hypothetical protein